MTHWFLHYLHHLIFDPVSEWERLKAVIFLDIPGGFVLLVIEVLISNWWDRYTSESDE